MISYGADRTMKILSAVGHSSKTRIYYDIMTIRTCAAKGDFCRLCSIHGWAHHYKYAGHADPPQYIIAYELQGIFYMEWS